MSPEAPLASGKISELEQKYILLLEARIAALETRLTVSESASKEVAKEKDQPTKKLTPDKPQRSRAESTSGSAAVSKAVKEDTKSKDASTNTVGDVTKENETDAEQESRYKIVLNEYDPDTGERVDKENTAAETTVSKEESESRKKSKAPRAFTFRKFLVNYTSSSYSSSSRRSSEVEIEEDELGDLLGEVLLKYSGMKQIKQMSSPYSTLIWRWEEAEEAANKVDGKDSKERSRARADLKELLRIISTASGSFAVEAYFKERETLLKEKAISFTSLWTLFPRGAVIVGHPYENEPQLFIVRDYDQSGDPDSPPTSNANFIINCYSYDWDGTTFNRVLYSVDIDFFRDKKKVFELAYYPLSFYQGGASTDVPSRGMSAVDRLKAELRLRGQKFKNCCIRKPGDQTFRYKGIAYHQKSAGLFRTMSSDGMSDEMSIYSGDREASSATVSKTQVDSTVVVDFHSYYEYQSPNAQILGDLKRSEEMAECSCDDCKKKFETLARFSWDQRKPKEIWGEEQYLLCPPRVLGYALNQKRWVQLKVNQLSEPDKASPRVFEDKLQLHQDYKNIIRNTVEAHTLSKEQNIVDHTPDKGKGLVILLWGLPGTGKSLTAISVAQLAGKPLFSVGVSEIGLQGDKIEKNLQKIFDLAGLWQAVLLFDEADVFLEARDDGNKSDIQRNTIVSVLLRALEYFEGILILTTNRLRSFDIAVQSRIHIALEYKDLTDIQRKDIFMDFFNQLHEKNLVAEVEDVKDWIDDYGKSNDFNGRQIRNVMWTAMSIANSQKRGLTRKDLSIVSKHVALFQKALQAQDTIYRATQIKPGK